MAKGIRSVVPPSDTTALHALCENTGSINGPDGRQPGHSGWVQEVRLGHGFKGAAGWRSREKSIWILFDFAAERYTLIYQDLTGISSSAHKHRYKLTG